MYTRILNKFKNLSEEQIFYRLGIILFILAIVFVTLHYTGIFTISEHMPACMVHSLTGFSCPGCGCTRAVHALFSGHILESLKYHPVIVYFFSIYIPFMVSHTIAFFRNQKYIKKETGDKPVPYESLPYHGMQIKFIYYLIAIILLLGFGSIRFVFELIQRIY